MCLTLQFVTVDTDLSCYHFGGHNMSHGTSGRLAALFGILMFSCGQAAFAAGLIPGTVTGGSGANVTTVTVTNFTVPAGTLPAQILLAIGTERASSAPALFGNATWNGHTIPLAVAQQRVNGSNSQYAVAATFNQAERGVSADLVVQVTVPAKALRVLVGVVEGLGPVQATCGSACGSITGAAVSSPVTPLTADAYVVDVFSASISTAWVPNAGQTKIGDSNGGEMALLMSESVGPTVSGPVAPGWSKVGASANLAHVSLAFPILPVEPPPVEPDPNALPPCAGDYLPPDNGMVNITTNEHCLVPNNGIDDATAAVQRCVTWFNDHAKDDSVAPESRDMLFAPDGRYLMTNHVGWLHADGTGGAYTGIRGQSKAHTVFVVPPNTPAFSNPAAQVVLFDVGHPDTAASTFNTNLENFTIEVGDGNPGLIGIHNPGNNIVYVQDVNIVANKDQCAIGYWLGNRYGPQMVDRLSVKGCRIGVLATASYYAATFNHPRMSENSDGGFVVGPSVLQIRDLVSDQSTGSPCVRFSPAANVAASMVELLGATCTGGQPGSAILVEAPSGAENRAGKGHFRNVVRAGEGYRAYERRYKPVSSNPAKNRPPDFIADFGGQDFTSEPTLTVAGGAGALQLEMPEHPHRIYPRAADWTNVSSYGVGDMAPVLEAKINAATTPVVYLVGGHLLGSTMHICNPHVKRIVGFEQNFKQLSSAPVSPIWSLCDGQSVELDTLHANRSSPAGAFPGNRVVKEGLGDVTITDSLFMNPVLAHGGANVFVRNVCCGGYDVENGNFTGYQVNVENDAVTDVRVVNGTARILGFKSEAGKFGHQFYFENAMVGIYGAFLHCGEAYTLVDREPFTVINSKIEAYAIAGMSGCLWDPLARVVKGADTYFLPGGIPASRNRGLAVTGFEYSL